MFEQTQKEIAEWAQRNFPNTPAHRPVLGMIEELGELAEAETDELAKDSVGDFAVYAMHYCALRSWQYSEVIKFRSPRVTATGNMWQDMLAHLGGLAHSHLKGEQGIRGSTHEHEQAAKVSLADLTAIVQLHCQSQQWIFEVVVDQTWATVKKRDWQKHQHDGVSR